VFSDDQCADILLIQSVVRGDIGDVRRALLEGANIESRHGKMTPLMRACAFGHADVVECLVDARANITSRAFGEWTALCYALSAGELDIAFMLLEFLGDAAEAQKDVARSYKGQILENCEASESEETLAALAKEFESGGLAILQLFPEMRKDEVPNIADKDAHALENIGMAAPEVVDKDDGVFFYGTYTGVAAPHQTSLCFSSVDRSPE